MHIFNQVFILSKGNEILLNLHELHDDTNNIHEQKYFLTKQSYDFSKKRKQVCSIYVVTFECNNCNYPSQHREHEHNDSRLVIGKLVASKML
jgi:hypothetical protein